MKLLLLCMAFAIATISCTKSYTCTCGDPAGGKKVLWTIKDTKARAKQKCAAENAKQPPMSEIFCQL